MELLVKLYKIIKTWEEGSISQAFKDGSMITMFKKGNQNVGGNYRGIFIPRQTRSLPGSTPIDYLFTQILNTSSDN
jgi:hypothetical protein